MTRVLVVDDNAANRDLLDILLRDAGAEVVTVADAAGALAAAAAARPDAVVVDLELPGTDGQQTAAALRLLPGLGDVLMVAVSATDLRSGDVDPVFASFSALPVDAETFAAAVLAQVGTVGAP